MRTATWENIGTSVRGEKKIEDVLTAAGLNYTVEKRPVYRYERNPRKLVRISNRFTCERREDGHSYDEIVSGKYTIVQNREAFDFVNYMSDEVEFLKAGETANGLVYIIGKLPDVNILGDPFTPHVIFSNSFTGKTSIEDHLPEPVRGCVQGYAQCGVRRAYGERGEEAEGSQICAPGEC